MVDRKSEHDEGQDEYQYNILPAQSVSAEPGEQVVDRARFRAHEVKGNDDDQSIPRASLTSWLYS